MDYNYSESSFAPELQKISKLLNSISTKKSELYNSLSEVDQRLSDLDHALELLNFDAIGLTKLVNRRKELVKERRKVKDEIEFIDAIEKTKINVPVISESIKKVAVSIEGTRNRHNNRTYIPKAETGIFNATLYSKNIGKKAKNPEKEAIVNTLTYTDEKGRTHKPSNKAIRMEQKFNQISKELHG